MNTDAENSLSQLIEQLATQALQNMGDIFYDPHPAYSEAKDPAGAAKASILDALQKLATHLNPDKPGWVVVRFSPDEIQGVDADRLQQRLVADGYQHIQDLQDQQHVWSTDTLTD